MSLIRLFLCAVVLLAQWNAAVAGTLRPDPNQPVGGTPVIFIHGWTDEAKKWDVPVKMLDEQLKPDGSTRFRFYRYEYDWAKPVEENGAGLGSEIKRLLGEETSFVVVAHSMGGLVARAAIENYDGSTPGLHRRLLKLITLATPHHGSPFANPAWIQNDTRVDAGSTWIKNSSIRILQSIPPLNRLDTPGGYSLGWDNHDGTMPDVVWNGRPASVWSLNPSLEVPAANRFVKILNEKRQALFATDPTLLSRYVAIGSYHQYVPSPLTMRLDSQSEMARTFLARGFQKNGRRIDNYVANDMVVPLVSALDLKDGSIVGALRDENVVLDKASIDAMRRNSEHTTYIVQGVNHSNLPSTPRVVSIVSNELKALTVTATPLSGWPLGESRWIGTWEGDDDESIRSRCSFDLLLNIERDGRSHGRFVWTLLSTGPKARNTSQIGQSGLERFEGRCDRFTSILSLRGTALVHNNLLVLDQYRLTLSPDGSGFSGKTRHHTGSWNAPITGERVEAAGQDPPTVFRILPLGANARQSLWFRTGRWKWEERYHDASPHFFNSGSVSRAPTYEGMIVNRTDRLQVFIPAIANSNQQLLWRRSETDQWNSLAGIQPLTSPNTRLNLAPHIAPKPWLVRPLPPPLTPTTQVPAVRPPATPPRPLPRITQKAIEEILNSVVGLRGFSPQTRLSQTRLMKWIISRAGLGSLPSDGGCRQDGCISYAGGQKYIRKIFGLRLSIWEPFGLSSTSNPRMINGKLDWTYNTGNTMYAAPEVKVQERFDTPGKRVTVIFQVHHHQGNLSNVPPRLLVAKGKSTLEYKAGNWVVTHWKIFRNSRWRFYDGEK